MKRLILSSIFIFGFIGFSSLSAQQNSSLQRCSSHEHLQDQIRQNPERGKSLEAIELRVERLINSKKPDNPGNGNGNGNPGGGGNQPPTPPTIVKVYIPVVVHIVYNKGEENITDAQVKSQIKVLNEDFNKANTEINNPGTIWSGYSTYAGDSKIEFCLTQIIRKLTSETSFSYSGDRVKKTASGGSSPINETTHLNIWSSNLGNSLLGYAQFPGGSSSTDGVVVHYKAFGSGSEYSLFTDYNLGRTATHEVGHWLGLRHIWGDRNCGDDKVGDTPLHDGANYGCGSDGETSKCKGRPVKMWMNYMDYTDDRCMYMFTNGQGERMNMYIKESRSGYALTSCPSNTISLTTNSSITSKLSDNSYDQLKLDSEKFKVYPTLNRGYMNFLIPSEKAGIAEIQVLNQLGSIMFVKRVSVMAGTNNATINTEQLSPGNYFIRLINSGKSQVQKIIVQ